MNRLLCAGVMLGSGERTYKLYSQGVHHLISENTWCYVLGRVQSVLMYLTHFTITTAL